MAFLGSCVVRRSIRRCVATSIAALLVACSGDAPRCDDARVAAAALAVLTGDHRPARHVVELSPLRQVAYAQTSGGRYTDERQCRAEARMPDGTTRILHLRLNGKGMGGLLGHAASPCLEGLDENCPR